MGLTLKINNDRLKEKKHAMPTYNTFEQLDCYIKCRKLRNWIHQFLIEKKIKDRDILQNLKRASRSTTRNIAEGFGRYHNKERIQYCRISAGSLHEIIEEFNIISDEDYCEAKELDAGKTLAFQALKSVRGYINYLNSKS